VRGIEWLVDVRGCNEVALGDPDAIVALFETIVERAGLRPIGRPVWHQFPTTGGITAIWMLRESHLTIHTFPEFRSASLNLFCCTPRPAPGWREIIERTFGPAGEVGVRECPREYGDPVRTAAGMPPSAEAARP